SRALVSRPRGSAGNWRDRIRIILLAISFAGRLAEILVLPAIVMISTRRKILTAIGVATIHGSLLAYGPTAHEIVGGIADQLIAKTPAEGKIHALVDGITL